MVVAAVVKRLMKWCYLTNMYIQICKGTYKSIVLDWLMVAFSYFIRCMADLGRTYMSYMLGYNGKFTMSFYRL